MLDIDGTALSMAGTFGAIGYGTLEPGSGANEEQISFTGLVNNANGTVTLTGVKNVSFVYPYTETSGLSKTHAGSTVFIISNTSGYYNKFVAKNNDGTVAETLTFTNPNIPEMNSQTVLSTDDAQFITKYHFDTNGGNTSNFNRTVVAGTAGETIAVDQLVYLKVSDGRWWLCDADTAATVENVILGIAQGAGTAGNSIVNGVLTNGLNTFSALTLTANTKYYASNTAGGFSSSAGTFEVSLGESQTTTTFLFMPRFDQQLTENQQDALVGDNTDITVGAGNLLVTQTGLQKAAEVYAASTTGNDTYVVTLSPVPTSLVNGMTIRFKPDTANTGAATLNVNSLGALAIVTGLSTALVTGDILANQVCEVIYNSTGTVWQLVNPVPFTANTLPSAIAPYVSNTYADQVSYKTYDAKILISGPDSVGGGYSVVGWTNVGITPASGLLRTEGGIFSFACGVDSYIYTNLQPLSKAQSSFRFADLGASEVRIKMDLVPSVVAASEIYGWGITEQANGIHVTRTDVTYNTIRFVLEENGGVDKLWACNSNGANYNATDITGAYNLAQEHIFELVITSTSIKYYVDGTLVATHSTYIPTGTSAVYLDYGFEYNGTGGARNIYPAVISQPLS